MPSFCFRRKMLKWTVMTRREPGDKSEQAASECGSVAKSTTSSSTTTTPRKTKRRRSSLGRRRSSCHKNRSSLEPDKENQFTSTPIKSPEGFAVQFDALRDVSNLTPTDNNRRVLSVKKCKSERKSPRIIKKKKSCLNNHPDVFNTDSHSSNFFRPFEAVDSHIEGILADEMYPTAYAPTLPTSAMDYSPCPMKSTHCLVTLNNASPKVTNDDCPPSKKPKFDHVDDFLHQISFITSPEDKRLKFPGLKLKNSAKKLLANEFKVSPLVKKFIDLRFSKISLNSKKHDDSSYINDLSLDQLVDAILESSSDSDRPKTSSTLNTSILCNIGNETELEKENDLNETHEENLINIEHERNRRPSFDGSSTDSGFRSSTTENSHQLDSNYLCKCNNNNKETSGNIICDKTIININETFNERCVDDETRLRKRSSDSSLESEPVTKRMNLDRSLEENFTLRRQKCIRRKEKPLKPFLGKASSPILDTIVNDESFECTPLNSCYMENKDIRQETYALEEGSPDQTQRIRRCLLFDSPKFEDFSGISEGNSTTKTTAVDVRGSLDLNIHTENDTIQVHGEHSYLYYFFSGTEGMEKIPEVVAVNKIINTA
ncbi:unnamed protein product [Brassicogethes aeneus]|uniref:Uncharacterized protein n=1 Tax=Brassicogethes aeneus TaxID=1431903 RepID=A0A9P0B2I0_BRAAE|nr:unnamed protein product [Brassicogethes aeneus]